MERDQGSSNEGSNHEDPTPSEICAVIITYHPDADVPTRARLIASQVRDVVVVDNGSGSAFDQMFRRLSVIPNLTLLRNDANLGIGAALNQGVRWAKDHGHRWVLLFDQDTVPIKSMVSELSQIYCESSRESKAVILGSNFLDVHSGEPWLDPSHHPNSAAVDFEAVATSGTFLPISAFDALGPFRSDLFVDLIDREYCLRARSHGYRVAITVKPLMMHAVGVRTKRRLLWRNVWPTNHPARRRYFYARNTLLLVREYGTRNPRWALSALSGLVKTVILILLFEDSKRAKLVFAARGVIAGFRGTAGDI
jgi:rhamnosyltransferase